MAVKVKGKAETKDKAEAEVFGYPWRERAVEKEGFHEYGFARFLDFMANLLDWEERGVREGDVEAQMVMHSVDMEVRLQDLEKKHQDLVDSLKIFNAINGKHGVLMGKEEDETV